MSHPGLIWVGKEKSRLPAKRLIIEIPVLNIVSVKASLKEA